MLDRKFTCGPWFSSSRRRRPFAGVGVRPLTAHGKIAAMAKPAIALNLDEAADVHLHLFAEITLDPALGFDRGANLTDFVLGEIFDFFHGVDLGFFRERTSALLPYAVDGGQSDPQALVRRQVNTCNACHLDSSL
jgi:hypothetical protein